MPSVRTHLKDHFIPHHGNGHHPHVLKHRVLVGYSALLLLVKAIGLTASIVLPSMGASASTITTDRIIALTNAARQNLSLPVLAVNARLAAAARAKAEDMAINQYFAHTSPAGVTPWNWIKSAGYAYRTSAENLAVHFSEAEDVQAGWMQSAGHKKNIIDPRFTEIGVGIATADFEGAASTFVVEMFGQPKTIDTPAAVAEEVPALEAPPATVTPVANGYKVELTASKATYVSAQLGNTAVPLTKDPVKPSTWAGTVPAPVTTQPQPITVSIQDETGKTESSVAAIVAPEAHLDQVFNMPYDTTLDPKIVGDLSLDGLQQLIRIMFILFILFLTTSLVIAIGYRLQLRNAPAMAHTAVVLALAVFLYAVS
ncbi:MAG: CAP domain-containing protein [Patescibacteria group bacterium]